MSERPASALPLSSAASWRNVVLAALLMVATLPGRTQGLGLITEPLLRDLGLGQVAYAQMNLWATLFGALLCLPMGWLLDRVGLRWPAAGLLAALAIVVWQMTHAVSGDAVLFLLLLLTRGLGQSALSVVSITLVGKTFTVRSGYAMGVYAVLLSIFFAAAFVGVGAVITHAGWRTAWLQIAIALVVLVPLIAAALAEPARSADETTGIATSLTGHTLAAALREPSFWLFAGATALFGLVSSGLGLFNEAVLAERGFAAPTFHTFLAVTTLFALLGQFLCGWLSLRWPMPRLLGLALLLYALSLAAMPLLRTSVHLWSVAFTLGLAGGMIVVLFFAVWGRAFGQAHLGRIQGSAQMLTVLASAIGPLLFAQCHESTGSYALVLYILAPLTLAFGLAAWSTSLPIAAPTEPLGEI